MWEIYFLYVNICLVISSNVIILMPVLNPRNIAKNTLLISYTLMVQGVVYKITAYGCNRKKDLRWIQLLLCQTESNSERLCPSARLAALFSYVQHLGNNLWHIYISMYFDPRPLNRRHFLDHLPYKALFWKFFIWITEGWWAAPH